MGKPNGLGASWRDLGKGGQRKCAMDPRMNPAGDVSADDASFDEQHESPAMTEGEAEPSAVATRPPFAWGRFFGYLGSVVVVAMMGGIGAAMYWGWTPLERKTREVVDTKITRIEIEWPRIGTAPVATKPAVGGASVPLPGSVREVSASEQAKPKDKKAGGKTKPAPKPEPKDEASLPWSVPEAATTWLPEQFQEDLLTKARGALGVDPDPMSRAPLMAVADSMERSGWFVGRPLVERRGGGLLLVRGTWRVPAAVVRQGEKDYLLSWESTPMPVDYKTDQSKLPAIVGVIAPPPVDAKGRDYASAWPGEEMDAAMELLRTLATETWYVQVAGVDVSKYRETKRLTILTRGAGAANGAGGGRIVWGGRASKPLVGEASTKAKIARLSSINRSFGRLDAGLDGAAKELEIFWGQGSLVLNIAATNTGALVEVPTP